MQEPLPVQAWPTCGLARLARCTSTLHHHECPSLQRQLGVFSATLLGLGSILGTGIFVSTGLALAFFVEPVVWLIGLGLALPGALWGTAARWLNRYRVRL